MAVNYQNEQLQINLQSVDNQYSVHEPFMQQIHNRYGIPLVQLESVLTNVRSSRKIYDDESTELDFGQKLVLNHNILKEMVHMIDNKAATKTSTSSIGSKGRFDNSKMDSKLREVKQKLEELIHFIGNPQNNNKKVSNNHQTSYLQSSLHYSRDILQDSNPKQNLTSHPIRELMNAQIGAHQQLQKAQQLDEKELGVNQFGNAKQVTSQVLSQNWGQASKLSRNQQIFNKSLERISEVQSGETIEKQSPLKKKDQNSKNEQSSIYNSNRQELDETGQLILSTINKKTTKVSVVSDKHRVNSKQSIPLKQQEGIQSSNAKEGTFWKGKSNKLSSLFLKSAVSHETIEEPKYFSRPRLKFDDFVRGFTFKSLQSSKNQLSVNSKQVESHQISNTGKPQFIRYIPVNNSASNSSYIKSEYSRPQNSLIKQSNIIQSFPSNHFDSPKKTHLKEQRQYIGYSPKGQTYVSHEVSNEQLKQTAHFEQADPSLKQSLDQSLKQGVFSLHHQSSAPYSLKRSLSNNHQAQMYPRTHQISVKPHSPTNQLSSLHSPQNSRFLSNQLSKNIILGLPAKHESLPFAQEIRHFERPIVYENIVRRKNLSKQTFLPVREENSQRQVKIKKKGIQLTTTNNAYRPYY